ncbi:hypothetical protein DIPPA_14095 [Diplonema papillatum]|nr:hypothetical protein DIPPA_14095 [Diplonema papillatum]|eukprot:gene6634-10157_t
MEDEDIGTVFVWNVSERVPDSNIQEMFGFCGKVEEFKKQWDMKKQTLGFVVRFAKPSAALAACALNNSLVDNRAIRVEGHPKIQAEADRNARDADQPLARDDTAPTDVLLSLLKAQGNDGAKKPVEPCAHCTSKRHVTEDCPILDSGSSSSCSDSSSSSSRRKRKRSKKSKKEKHRKTKKSKSEKKSSKKRRK